MQRFAIEVQVPIPEDKVLLSRADFEELKGKELSGVYWSMKDLEARTNKKSEWIKENILYPSEFKGILDVENGGFVYYPKVKGEKWVFHAQKMADFLDEYFHQIFNN
ncbi:DUF771 domain-containing protein [Alkalibacillus haloalkaliphilus]|uniref:DUF771 domain-containing protein n=1 Tax=Alkalibacillus haloalkaliphilus TaxID=94136 RepID=A0A511W6N0_9BACI|nr:DUF771 domain-containing protein [Alkalibacillus haloalkaliphilus]GEN46754.1 hypothetical protein AHA02nite_25300 [Alkalibacillus haloalkaliphilus]